MNSSNASEQCCSELQTEETSVLEGSERLQTATVYRPHADIVDSEINVVLHLNLPGVNLSTMAFNSLTENMVSETSNDRSCYLTRSIEREFKPVSNKAY